MCTALAWAAGSGTAADDNTANETIAAEKTDLTAAFMFPSLKKPSRAEIGRQPRLAKSADRDGEGLQSGTKKVRKNCKSVFLESRDAFKIGFKPQVG
jgi:hypothetical protein